MTARLRAAAGSTPGSTKTASTRRAGVTPVTSAPRAGSSRRNGRGRGPRTGGSSTTARAPIRRAGRGLSASATCGGTSDEEKWTGYDVPDFPVTKRPDYRRHRTPRHGRDLRHGSVHHDGGRTRLAVLAQRSARRAAAHVLRAARVADTQPPLPGDRWQPGRDPLAPARESVPRDRRPAVPDRGDDLPADRASHGGRDEPNRPVAGRAPARDVCRDRSAARRRPRHRGRRLDDDRHRAGGDRGAGQGHRTHPPPTGRRTSDSPDSTALALGLQRALDAATRPTSSSPCPAIRTCRSRTTRRSLATCAPAAGMARAPRDWPESGSPGTHIRPNEDDPSAENPQEHRS